MRLRWVIKFVKRWKRVVITFSVWLEVNVIELSSQPQAKMKLHVVYLTQKISSFQYFRNEKSIGTLVSILFASKLHNLLKRRRNQLKETMQYFSNLQLNYGRIWKFWIRTMILHLFYKKKIPFIKFLNIKEYFYFVSYYSLTKNIKLLV